jgi:hypothetical protein
VVRSAITVRLSAELLERLNTAAMNRRDVRQPLLSVARDELIERAVSDMLAGYLKPVSPPCDPGRPA